MATRAAQGSAPCASQPDTVQGIFGLVGVIHPRDIPEPSEPCGTSRGTHPCPPQPQLLGLSPAFGCLRGPFGSLQRDGEQLQGADLLAAFFGGVNLCARPVPCGARHALHGGTTSPSPPFLPPSFSPSLSPGTSCLPGKGVLNGVNEPPWQRFQQMVLPQAAGWERVGSGEGKARGHVWG